jgi:hypothetical protein
MSYVSAMTMYYGLSNDEQERKLGDLQVEPYTSSSQAEERVTSERNGSLREEVRAAGWGYYSF